VFTTASLSEDGRARRALDVLFILAGARAQRPHDEWNGVLATESLPRGYRQHHGSDSGWAHTVGAKNADRLLAIKRARRHAEFVALRRIQELADRVHGYRLGRAYLRSLPPTSNEPVNWIPPVRPVGSHRRKHWLAERAAAREHGTSKEAIERYEAHFSPDLRPDTAKGDAQERAKRHWLAVMVALVEAAFETEDAGYTREEVRAYEDASEDEPVEWPEGRSVDSRP